MKYLLTVLTASLMLLPNYSPAKDFTYSQVIGCGPSKPEGFSFLKMVEAHRYFFIHKATNGDFVVWNNFHQYASFEPLTYHQLYVQNGGVTSASMQLLEGIERYTLTTVSRNKTVKEAFLFDSNNMTFISRVAGFEPQMGVCWREK